MMLLFNKNSEVFDNDEEYVSSIEKINESGAGEKKLERRKRSLMERFPVVDEKLMFSIKLSEVYSKRRMIGGPLISGILYNASYVIMQSNDKLQDDKFNETYRFLQNYMFRLINKLDISLWSLPLVEYIYAHAASQIVLYNSSENNYLSKTVHEFAELNKDSVAYDFVRKWMIKFEIGKDFRMESIGGEAHTFEIIDFDGKRIPLADKRYGNNSVNDIILENRNYRK